MAEVPEEDRFMANTLGMTKLMHELISAAYAKGFKEINPQIIGLAGGYLSGYNKTDLIETFITHTYEECWEKIRLSNDDFFISHSTKIFGKLPVDESYIGSFGSLFTKKHEDGSAIISVDDKKALFRNAQSLVKICIKYIHRKREVKLVEIDGVFKPRYLYNFFPEIKVRELAKLWDIKLPMPQI